MWNLRREMIMRKGRPVADDAAGPSHKRHSRLILAGPRAKAKCRFGRARDSFELLDFAKIGLVFRGFVGTGRFPRDSPTTGGRVPEDSFGDARVAPYPESVKVPRRPSRPLPPRERSPASPGPATSSTASSSASRPTASAASTASTTSSASSSSSARTAGPGARSPF